MTPVNGLEQLHVSCSARAVPASGITRLLGITTDALEDGHVGVRHSTTRPEMCNPAGHGARRHRRDDARQRDVLCGALDLARRRALHDRRLHIHYTRPIRPDHGHIVATGDVVHRGSRIATGGGSPRRRRRQAARARHHHLPRDAGHLVGCAPCLASVHPPAALPKGKGRRAEGHERVHAEAEAEARRPAGRDRRVERGPASGPRRRRPQGRERGHVAAEGRTHPSAPRRHEVGRRRVDRRGRRPGTGAGRGRARQHQAPGEDGQPRHRQQRPGDEPSGRRRRATSRTQRGRKRARSCSSDSRMLGRAYERDRFGEARRLLEPLARDAPGRRACASSTA